MINDELENEKKEIVSYHSFSRMLRDSMAHFVGWLVSWSVCPSEICLLFIYAFYLCSFIYAFFHSFLIYAFLYFYVFEHSEHK